MTREMHPRTAGYRILELLRWIGVPASLGLVMLVGCQAEVSTSGNSDDFLRSGRTLSHFQAVQVDPRSEDSAGPQFVAAEDLNGDGLMDLVSAWNQSQPVQIHLQRRTVTGTIRFETLILAGNVPALSVAGLSVADLDSDGRADIIVLVKSSALEAPGCLDDETPEGGLSGVILTYFGPEDSSQTDQALAWEEVQIGASFLHGTETMNGNPEDGGFTGMAVGDINVDGQMDIVVAWNSLCGGGTKDVVVFTNRGPEASRDGRWSAAAILDDVVKGTVIKDVALGDVDGDGDLDVVATYPDSPAFNIRWYRNPAIDVPDDYHVSDEMWQVGVVGQVATGADTIRIADLDRDGILDVVVRSTNGAVIQWLKGPAGPTTVPLRAIPWQVYTLAEFLERIPEAVALGDVNFDGRIEVFAAAEGGVVLLNSQAAESVYDQWIEQLVVDDLPPGRPLNSPPTTDPNVAPEEIAGATLINSLLVVDVDGDGSNDVVATLDRSGLSGLSNDALAWFRNTRRSSR